MVGALSLVCVWMLRAKGLVVRCGLIVGFAIGVLLCARAGIVGVRSGFRVAMRRCVFFDDDGERERKRESSLGEREVFCSRLGG